MNFLMRFLHLKIEKNVINSLMIYALSMNYNHYLKRLQVAKMIKQGYTYATIEKESGASTATISRVKRSLQWGNDAYTMILERLNIETKNNITFNIYL